eukprot:TRINITY_DN29768_c0_g1_i1.p1 TRINITY_DN29768_c0_g1~~TRINITY_DN29768_c0_g1_i1.p1  ORF type:complete len:420 (-),score=94.76 TRINITY_DN29768_c0_g1_i1:327-1586(-)
MVVMAEDFRTNMTVELGLPAFDISLRLAFEMEVDDMLKVYKTDCVDGIVEAILEQLDAHSFRVRRLPTEAAIDSLRKRAVKELQALRNQLPQVSQDNRESVQPPRRQVSKEAWKPQAADKHSIEDILDVARQEFDDTLEDRMRDVKTDLEGQIQELEAKLQDRDFQLNQMKKQNERRRRSIAGSAAGRFVSLLGQRRHSSGSVLAHDSDLDDGPAPLPEILKMSPTEEQQQYTQSDMQLHEQRQGQLERVLDAPLWAQLRPNQLDHLANRDSREQEPGLKSGALPAAFQSLEDSEADDLTPRAASPPPSSATSFRSCVETFKNRDALFASEDDGCDPLSPVPREPDPTLQKPRRNPHRLRKLNRHAFLSEPLPSTTQHEDKGAFGEKSSSSKDNPAPTSRAATFPPKGRTPRKLNPVTR